MGQIGLAVDRRKRAVHGVRAVGDFDAANARDVIARVEGQPFLAEIDFAIGVKIHRRAGINETNVGQVSGDVTGGQIERAAQRNDRVREIAADTVSTGDYFRGREVGPPGTEAVFNVVVNPVADGLHARKAVGDLAKV